MSDPPRSLELSPVATVGLLVLFGTSGGLGYLWAGIGGAFFSALGITTTVAVAWGVMKVRANDRTRLTESAPNLAGLAPAQALSVMGAMTGSDAGLSFKSELLTELEAVDETLEQDPPGAIDALGPFVQNHPRSPAVHLRLARAHRCNDDDALASDSAASAIRLAVDGGMNPMAVSIFVEFADAREGIQLEARHWTTLGKALRARGHEDHATWCEQRAG